MKNVKFKKLVTCLVSAFIVTTVAVSASACSVETAHPEARVTYEFNGETYSVDYTLYRNMYPATVRHFIELTENKFYDNTVIHSYNSNDWLAGGYEYNAEDYASLSDNASRMAEYFEKYSKEDAYVALFNEGKFTSSVYSNRGYDDKGNETVKSEEALPTVMGEFYNNIHREIEKGALTAEYGCLKMYYNEKKSTQKVFVTVDKQVIMADYKSNCATSLFSVQSGTSSSYSETNYTVFARLKDTSAFDDFVDAVRAYITNNHGGTASNFYNAASVNVENNDTFTNQADTDKGTSVTFNAPKTPIIVKEVKITRY